uniref:Mannosyltransferase n=1 Tax=Strigamia maritima TaxID=126957 RepID=T1IM57_STRMM
MSNDAPSTSTDFKPEFGLFPRYSIYFLAFFVVCNRVSIAINDENLWMIHPDEIFQSVEIAHSEAYGYGFRPYEYIAPPPDGATNLSISEARYFSLGMYSMRSWLYPRTYQLLFSIKECLNFTSLSPYYVAKVFHSTFASLLPFSVYKFSFSIYRNSDTAFISAFFVAFSSSLIVLGTRTLIQSFNSPIIFSLMTLMIKKQKTSESEHFNAIKHYVCGIGFGLVLSMRVDIAIFYSILTVTFYSYFEKSLYLLTGFITGLSLGGLNDYLNYGHLFISSRNWFAFQINSHITLILLIFSTIFIFYQFFTFFFPIFVFAHQPKPKPKPTFTSTFNRLWLATVYLLLIYSLNKHKEIRFIHDALVLVQISLAGMALLICRYVYNIIPFGTRLNILKLIVYGELLIYSVENRLKYPRASNPESIKPWAYAGLVESGLVNRALSFISEQRDVTGVLIDYSIHMTGAYTLLHHNVPIISKTHFEFREWVPEIRVNTSRFVRVNTIDRIKNFISVYNVQLLLKYVIKTAEYNYFLTTGGRGLPKRGFRQVFNTSNNQVRVYKRSRSRTEREDLIQYGDRLPTGTNSTILEYESSWLITLELYEKAVERLEFCVTLDAERIRTWQLLQLAYLKLGRISDADDAIKRCNRVNGRAECAKKQEKVVLHSEYQLNNTFRKIILYPEERGTLLAMTGRCF